MTIRRLPHRRVCRTIKLRVGNGTGLGLYLQIGEYEDGEPGEIVLSVAKAGSMLRGFLDSFSWAVSSALQHGEPLESICRTHRGHHYEPNGCVRHYAGIESCTSIPDLVCQVLEREYP